MVENGLVEEVRKTFDPDADYSRGIRRAIGVPEFDKYFRQEPYLDKHQRLILLHEAIAQMKENTCKLARRQLGKILRLRNKKGWNMHRLDATEVFLKHGSKEADEAWKELVARTSTRIVDQFPYNFASKIPAKVAAGIKVRRVGTAIAAGTF